MLDITEVLYEEAKNRLVQTRDILKHGDVTN